MAKIAYSLLCLAGLLLSGYALYVEYKSHIDKEYVPMCAIKNSFLGEANCQDVFLSQYGKGMFGLIDNTKVNFIRKMSLNKVPGLSNNVSLQKSVNNYLNQIKQQIAEVPNTIPGLVFYLAMFLLGRHRDCKKSQSYAFWLTFLSLATSVYLGYILLYILQEFCIVCCATYIVNIGLLWQVLAWGAELKQKGGVDAQKKKE